MLCCTGLNECNAFVSHTAMSLCEAAQRQVFKLWAKYQRCFVLENKQPFKSVTEAIETQVGFISAPGLLNLLTPAILERWLNLVALIVFFLTFAFH